MLLRRHWKLEFETAEMQFSVSAFLLAHSNSFNEFCYCSTFVSMWKKFVKWKKYAYLLKITLPWFDEFLLIICKFQTIVKFVKTITVFIASLSIVVGCGKSAVVPLNDIMSGEWHPLKSNFNTFILAAEIGRAIILLKILL